MHTVISNSEIAPSIVRMVVEAPLVARKRQAGQFVIIRPSEQSERIPLTIVDADAERGAIMLIIQVVGATTRELAAIPAGGQIADVVGPLGRPTRIERVGAVVSIGGGVGAAVALPIARAMKQAGNTVIGIIGARNRSLVILEGEMRRFCDEVLVYTDDGSYGVKGLVTDALQALIAAGRRIDLVLAVGPVVMMRAVSELTRRYAIRTIVSLNPIMTDATGMCGGCRVEVGGEVRFACVDGPEFDGHQVDFGLLMRRLAAYRDLEKQADEACRLQLRKH